MKMLCIRAHWLPYCGAICASAAPLNDSEPLTMRPASSTTAVTPPEMYSASCLRRSGTSFEKNSRSASMPSSTMVTLASTRLMLGVRNLL